MKRESEMVSSSDPPWTNLKRERATGALLWMSLRSMDRLSALKRLICLSYSAKY
jgi:hypothetical protein